MTISTVTVYYDADGVPSEGTTGGGEVPPGTPAQQTSDAAKVPGSRTPEQLEADRRAQQSVYDRKLADAERRYQELAQRLEQMQTQGMDDAQKIAYERDQLKAKMAEYEARQRINDYADAFCTQFKLDKSKLDLTNEDTIAQSGWAAVIERQTQLEQEIETLKTPKSSPTTPSKAAPQNTTKVVTGSGGVPKKMTQLELMSQVAQSQGRQSISHEEFYRWAERNPEAYNQWLQDQATE